MTILSITQGDLSEEQRVELDEVVGDPARFHSDGREIRQAAIILPIIFTPLAFVLAHELRESYELYGNPMSEIVQLFPQSLLRAVVSAEFLELLGIIAIAIVAIGGPVYWLRTRGRHGYAFTSFGIVRVRGPSLRLLRYEDISEVNHRERRYPRHRVITDELEIKSKDGKSLMIYGFGLGLWQRQIEAQRPDLGSARSS